MAKRRKNKRKRAAGSKSADIRRRAFKVFLAFFVVVSLVVLGKLAAQKIVLFPIKDIEVLGNKHLSDNEISKMSRLEKGESIFAVRSRTVVKRLEASPWIRSVSVRKEMPDRIVIMITEAVPSALLNDNGEYFLVGSDGKVLEKQGDGEKFLPVIKGDPKDRKAIQEAVKFANVLTEYGVDPSERSEILVDKLENMTFNYGGTSIKVGYGQYEAKLLRYLELKDEIARRGIPVNYIDLRYDRRVVVRAVDGGSN
ncbi:MAG: FtsQ-type POTRA domain-containing protein [Nitrospirota bacterium]|nr:MAG: FtsQ-type POTRA domain-containing protein [Nitrospirota bacterium]